MISIEYAAGFFDGEGSVGLYHKSRCATEFTLLVQVAGTHRGIIEEIYGFFKSLGGWHNRRTYRCNHSKRDVWVWCISGRGAYSFLKEIHPFSIVKKSEIELALQYYEEMVINRKKRVILRDTKRNRWAGSLPLDPKVIERRQWYSDTLKSLKKGGGGK